MSYYSHSRIAGFSLIFAALLLAAVAGRGQDRILPPDANAASGKALPSNSASANPLFPKHYPANPPVENTVVPMTFPVMGKVDWEDSFNMTDASRGRIHHGEDLMASKMTPLVAAFDGIVFVNRTPGHNMLSIEGDNGFSCLYCHINDDTPGTKDHTGSDDYAYAPGLKSGDHVVAGQLVAWVGDSGNARGGPSHCHFELTYGALYLNPAISLRAARRITSPLLSLSHPELRPKTGEVRLDGVVRSFDNGKTLVMRTIAVTRSDGKTTVLAKPTRRWVLLQPDTVLRQRDMPDILLTRETLKPDMPIIVLGKDRGNDKAVFARLAAAHLLPAEPAITENTFSGRTAGNGSSIGTGGIQTQNSPRVKPGGLSVPTRLTVADRVLTPAENHLIELLNDFRRENNLPLLVIDPKLSEVAWKHSLDMANAGFYSHTGSDGSPLAVRLNLAGLVYNEAYENLAVNFAAEEKVVEAWLAPYSQSRRTLLNPVLTAFGVAHVHISAGDGLVRRVEHAWTLVLIKL